MSQGTQAASSSSSIVLRAPDGEADGSAPKLIIGKVSIEGEEFKLKKPLAVMALNKAADGTREYRALGVVRHKVIFRRHPLPIHNGGRAAAAAPMTEANKRQRLSVNGQEAVTPSPLPAAIA